MYIACVCEIEDGGKEGEGGGGEERRERDCTNALVPLTRISEYGQEFPNDDFFFPFFSFVRENICLSFVYDLRYKADVHPAECSFFA